MSISKGIFKWNQCPFVRYYLLVNRASMTTSLRPKLPNPKQCKIKSDLGSILAQGEALAMLKEVLSPAGNFYILWTHRLEKSNLRQLLQDLQLTIRGFGTQSMSLYFAKSSKNVFTKASSTISCRVASHARAIQVQYLFTLYRGWTVLFNMDWSLALLD